MLRLDNYSNYILNNISLKIENRNLIILGENGSGKTTLALMLSKLLENNDVLFKKSNTKLINYIPVGLDIFDEFITVFEFLDINCLHNKYSINEVLRVFNINYLKNKSCKNLSSGEAQLASIVGAILHNAKYTIFDEPTSNLDPLRVKKIYTLLKQNRYLEYKIIITHNLNLAYKLGYDIIFLKDGKIIFDGSCQNFFNTTNLTTFFNNSVQKIHDNIMIDL
ncbi:Zinc ABC transporter, ATP-binding protein ZnuC [hydrothermal vent metagenome]|uniref:Zinc ABC transporter, ATP-binding protein ZnuC n=1 Tax=hydrothermal vent metagenome TaxID=652676 RepID=A0A3B1E4D9_9ZZZZ